MRILPAFTEIDSADAERFEQISLREQIGQLDDSLREPLAQYLEGSQMLMSAGNIIDPLGVEKGPVVPFGFSTDGEWAWPTYWAYFVREYGVSAPDDFMEHVKSRGFVPTDLTDEQAQQAADGIQKALYG
ncbi:hypothetical protein AQJ43_15285 [Streptomyces avermitilis]|nr:MULTISPECIES: hypothetical protein [Streptomyces]KUN54665.1 hypothetical protein AQJ43_15285 [Streptomyces avermitilis]MYT01323.1 hypothetical protein [Streptomyces sp. SID5469]OOV30917.1 hypothetical protein SM007_17250 [Streptomyces avermitilis]BBJ53937.1 hypothetical protein SAVMC3_65660 [Streptomyces avermitilis]GDY65948.1 hypothetical protein SAV14893_053410 [Streptomyces avermitilis]